MSKALNEKPNAEPLPAAASAGVTVNGKYLPPPEDKDGKIWVRTSALIQANDLHKLWRDIENAPLWQEQIVQVTKTGQATSHWVSEFAEAKFLKDGDHGYGGLLDKVPLGAAFGQGITMKMGQTNMHNYMKPLLERIEKRQIDPSYIISHRITLDEAPEVYKVWRDKKQNVTKIVIDPWATIGSSGPARN